MSIYLAGWWFDMSGSYTVIYVISIILLVSAGIASDAVQGRRYSRKYLFPAEA